MKMEYKLFPKYGKIGQYTFWLGIYFLTLIVGALRIGTFGSLLKILAFIPILIWITKNHSFKKSNLIRATVPFAFWCFMSIIWSINFSASFERGKTQILFLIMLLSADGYAFNEEEIDYLKNCLVWSSRITAILALLSADFVDGRMYLNGIVQEDPNYLCAYFLFAIVSNVYLIMNKDIDRIRKFVGAVELLVYAYILLGTGSRGGMFATITSIAVIILTYKDKSGVASGLIKKIAIILMLYLAYYFASMFLDADIMQRFTAEAISKSNGTGRYDLWKDAINAFNNSTFFRQLVGYGTATVRDITYLFPFSRHNVVHNIFVENLIEIGSIGVVFYVLHIGVFLYVVIKNKYRYALPILAGMIVLSLSTSLYAFKPYWNILLFILCSSNSENGNNSV